MTKLIEARDRCVSGILIPYAVEYSDTIVLVQMYNLHRIRF